MESIIPRSQPRAFPWPALISALVWFGVLEITLVWPRAGYIVAGLLVFLLPAWNWRGSHPAMPRWLRPLTAWLLLLSSLAAMTLVNTQPWPHLIALGSAWLLCLTWQTADQTISAKARGRLFGLILVFTVLCSWLTMLSFSLGLFFVLPWWWMVIAAAMFMTLWSIVSWVSFEVPLAYVRRVLPLTAWLGAELMIAIWWLPTAVHVGAIVATTITMFWLQAMRHMWRGDWEPGRGRRYVIVGASVVGLLLLTARWR